MVNPWNNAKWPLLTAGDGKGSTAKSNLGIEDPIQLQNSDNPGMILVSHPLTGANYLPWRKAMTIALGAKSKLGFVNGKIPEPDEMDENYDTWKKSDYMITSWILNTLSKDIVEILFM
ncbi:Unknown protein [Striga hermonthica]|uniref:Retrotransposon Copia-like N-terminal domain-containing protein n=1 Tax=Striga hermonthica TaxID=68872 RepID=A0A9N7NZ25_STRHE|nr:Unknown protein [Striga hermonthica]